MVTHFGLFHCNPSIVDYKCRRSVKPTNKPTKLVYSEFCLKQRLKMSIMDVCLLVRQQQSEFPSDPIVSRSATAPCNSKYCIITTSEHLRRFSFFLLPQLVSPMPTIRLPIYSIHIPIEELFAFLSAYCCGSGGKPAFVLICQHIDIRVRGKAGPRVVLRDGGKRHLQLIIIITMWKIVYFDFVYIITFALQFSRDVTRRGVKQRDASLRHLSVN